MRYRERARAQFLCRYCICLCCYMYIPMEITTVSQERSLSLLLSVLSVKHLLYDLPYRQRIASAWSLLGSLVLPGACGGAAPDRCDTLRAINR